jgi:hypothetical protein
VHLDSSIINLISNHFNQYLRNFYSFLMQKEGGKTAVSRREG